MNEVSRATVLRGIGRVLHDIGVILFYATISIPLGLPILKLCGVVSWSWWAVMSPLIFIISAGVVVVAVLFTLIVITVFMVSFIKAVKRAAQSRSTNDRSNLN